jgi:ADP-heptose:LPS heptosyltransferase
LDLLELASGVRAPITYGCAIPDDITAQAAALLPAPPPASVIGLAPGAGARRKCWPLVDYIALAWRLQQQGHQVAWLVGPGEGDWLESLRQATPDALFPLQEAAARGWTPSPLLTIALAQRFAVSVANDSGVGHMLAAANTPLISLFGPTDPAKFAPISEKLSILRFDPEQPSLAMDGIFAAVQDWLGQPVVAAAS